MPLAVPAAGSGVRCMPALHRACSQSSCQLHATTGCASVCRACSRENPFPCLPTLEASASSACPSAPPPQGNWDDWPPVYSERRLVAAAEMLLGAGYRPARLAWAWHMPEEAQEPVLLRHYSPFDAAVAAQGTQLARMLRMAVDRPPWSLAAHRHFPPAFRETTRAVLLAARHRQRMAHAASLAGACSSGHASGALAVATCCPEPVGKPAAPDWLADLPGNAVLVAIGLAACPLSRWL
ncbi:hypothetical protein ABPG75_005605 [Micractinium tetrahymenae]